MRKFITLLLLQATLFAQVYTTGRVTTNGQVSFKGGPILLQAANAQLPTSWATSKESTMVSSFDVTKNITVDYVCTTPANCFAALQQAYCDWQAAADQNWKLIIPHGTLIQTGTAVTCTQTGATTYRSWTLNTKLIGGVTLPTKYFVVHSDTPLTVGTTPCSHATDDTGVRQPPTGDISTWWTGSNYGCGNDRPSMWTLEGNWAAPGNVGELIQAGAYDVGTNLGPSHVIIADVELRPATTVTSSIFLVQLNEGAAFTAPTLLTQAPSEIHFYNFYLHADATDWCGVGNPLSLPSCTISSGSGGYGNNRIATGIKFVDCQNCSATYFYTDYLLSSGAEDHVIDSSRTNGPLKIAHGYISGGSMAVFFGGEAVDDPLESVLDVQVTSNFMTMPISWVGNNYGGASNIVSKNRLEVKVVNRLLVEGNYIENQDTSGGQEGQCLELNPRNTSGGPTGNNYQVVVQNVTVRNNVCRNSATGFSNAAYSSYPGGNGGGITAPGDFWTFEYNLLYGLGSAFYDSTKHVASPYAFRTSGIGPGVICSGTNAAGVQTYTCDNSVDGLRQVQVRVSDFVVITNCANPNWDAPAIATGAWENNRGIQAISGTLPASNVIVVANPSATGGSTTGCVIEATGGPYHQLVRHNTVIMQSDAYPSTCSGCASTKNVAGAASITSGLATVTVVSAPIAVPNVASINIVGADIADYNCSLCLVTAVSGNTITYQTTSADRAGDVIGAGQIQQPPNNAAVYNGGSTVQFFTDVGCSGAGPKNSTAVTAWSRDNATGVVSATISTTTGWGLLSLGNLQPPQVIVESNGNGTASGLFYYLGRVGNVVSFSQPGATETGATFGTLAQMGKCAGNQFAENDTYIDNLIVVDEGTPAACATTGASPGWQGWISQGGANLEGCRSGSGNVNCAENHLDPQTSIVTYTDFPGRCVQGSTGVYMEMGGPFAFSIPPVTLTGPASSRCPTAFADATCVGMKTMMNGAPFDPSDADPSQYVLDPTSFYKQGHAFAADDGTDLGIGTFTVILNANHSVQYVCPSLCGVPGPYVD